MNLKLRVARAQLGTALSLFIDDCDPLSVHALACGGTEIVEGLAEKARIKTFTSHTLMTFPEFRKAQIIGMRTLHWNALKHFYKRKMDEVRDDEDLLKNFSDELNDFVLYWGWHDYMMVTGRLPVEAQIFQVWWGAVYDDKLAPTVDRKPYQTIFPDLKLADRKEQKRRLAAAVQYYLNDPKLLADPKTETEPLIAKS